MVELGARPPAPSRPAQPAPPLDPARAALLLCAAAHFVAGFAVGTSFRVPVLIKGVRRFLYDPLTGLILGAIAAAGAGALVWAAMAVRTAWIRVAVCVLGGALVGLLNAALSLSLVAVVRTGVPFQAAIAPLKTALGPLVVPPGLFWSAGTAFVVFAAVRAARAQEPLAGWTVIAAGGVCLAIFAEAGLLVFAASALARVVSAVGLLGGVACFASAVRKLDGRARAALIRESVAAIAAGQLVVGGLAVYSH